jgi:hypothetical protein
MANRSRLAECYTMAQYVETTISGGMNEKGSANNEPCLKYSIGEFD